jgi:DNA topoisomerase-3
MMPPGMQLVVAEKPSVARDLARVLGVRPSGRHAFEGPDRVITWCVGHLVELEEPAAYDARWKPWRLDTLPMVPERFKLRPVASSRDQLEAVRKLLRDGRFTEVVNACDAGREGELIFRYVYELSGCRLPSRRLWISSLTDEAIRAGFARLQPGRAFDPLGDAARCRSEADWLVGLNATRAVTVRHRRGERSTLYSIGRVQTPTLAIVVERENAIRGFVPRDYFELRGRFTTAGGAAFEALWTADRATRLGARALADELSGRVAAHAAAADPAGPTVERLEEKKTREPPPLLFDLTSLQRTANRRFGLSAADTLRAAQALYETYKILTYPRTDSRHLSGDMRAEMGRILRGVAGYADYQPFADRLLPDPPAVGRRVFDDAKVSDHHAIIPTGKVVDVERLPRDERRVFDLVVRRFVGAFYPDAEFAATEVVVRVGAEGAPGEGRAPGPGREAAGDGRAPPPGGEARPDGRAEARAEERLLERLPPPPDRFVARGRVRLVAGWQEVAGFGGEDAPEAGPGRGKRGGPPREGAPGEGGRAPAEAAEPPATLPPLARGQRLDGAFEIAAKQTKPPPRHTEATLLGSMETAGRLIEDEELRAAMKDAGLGTPATRASIIETLLRRGFLRRDGKALVPTPLGMALIDVLPTRSLASPELTGRWEARLSRIARGEEARSGFMKDIVAYVSEVVDAIRRAPPSAAMASGAAAAAATPAPAPGPGASRTPGDGRPRARAGGQPSPPPAARRRSAAAPRSADSPSAARAPRDAAGEAAAPAPLRCPRCREGLLMAGKRGWGCGRWREGCTFVVWFELHGKRLSDAQLKDLVEKGKTRKTTWPAPGAGGKAQPGRLVLDLAAPRDTGGARFEPG